MPTPTPRNHSCMLCSFSFWLWQYSLPCFSQCYKLLRGKNCVLYWDSLGSSTVLWETALKPTIIPHVFVQKEYKKSTRGLGRNEGTMRQDILFCSSPGRFGHKTHVYRKLHKILEVMSDLIGRGKSGWWERSGWDKLSGVHKIQIYKIPTLEGLSFSHDAPGKCLRLITPRGFVGRSRHKSIHQSSDPNLLPPLHISEYNNLHMMSSASSHGR